MNRPAATPVSVTMLMTAETQPAPLSGLCEALTAFPLLADFEPDRDSAWKRTARCRRSPGPRSPSCR